jgi:hypothetical protein
MCDLRQTFGLDVSLFLLAMDSGIISASLMALAAVSHPDLLLTCHEPLLPNDMASYTCRPWHDTALEQLVALALVKARRFMLDAHRSWEPTFTIVNGSFSQTLCPTHFFHDRHRRLCWATLALLTRLGQQTPRIMFSWQTDTESRNCAVPGSRRRSGCRILASSANAESREFSL